MAKYTSDDTAFLLAKIKQVEAGHLSPSDVANAIENYFKDHPQITETDVDNIVNAVVSGYLPLTGGVIGEETKYVRVTEDGLEVVDSDNSHTIKITADDILVDDVSIADIYTKQTDFDTLSEKVADMELFKFPNAIINGEPTINNGQISNFSTTSYLALPSVFDLNGRGFELKLAFTTNSDITTSQNILGGIYCMALYIANSKLSLRVSSNGNSWNLVNTEAETILNANTTYYAKLIFNRLAYKLLLSTDDINYNEIINVATGSISPHPSQLYLGVGNGFVNPFKGIINLNKCYLKVNNSVIWQGMDDAGLATRLATDLENIDEDGINKVKEIIAKENYVPKSGAIMEEDAELTWEGTDLKRTSIDRSSISVRNSDRNNTSDTYIASNRVKVSNVTTNSEVTPEYVVENGVKLPDKYASKNEVNSRLTNNASKNLLNCSRLQEQTVNGVTFSPIYNSNGLLEYINVDGTATTTAQYIMNGIVLPTSNKKYTLTGCPTGGSATTYKLDIIAPSFPYATDYGEGTTVNYNSHTDFYSRIVVYPNTVCNNLKFYPMFRYADITGSTYEPYYPSNVELNEKFNNYLPLTGGTITGDLGIKNVVLKYDEVNKCLKFNFIDNTTASDLSLDEDGVIE